MKSLTKKIITIAAAAALAASAIQVSYAKTLYAKSIDVETGVEIELNGSKFTPTDAQGNEVEPLLYNGTTYLPVRALSTALGNEIAWDGETATVSVTSNTELADKAAIKELVDTFSVLADEKDAEGQGKLFTEDATVKIFMNGEQTNELVGREQIQSIFANFSANNQTVYHFNGQQTTDVNGDTATGTAYCQAITVNEVDGVRNISISGIIYHDTYKKVDGKWLIAARESNFMYRDGRALN